MASAAVLAVEVPREAGKTKDMAGNFKFTQEEKDRIENAVAALEKESSGEIVVYFGKSSYDYLDVRWFVASFFGIVTMVVLLALYYLWLIPGWFDLPYQIGLIILFMLFGFLSVTFSTRLRVVLVNDKVAQHHVNQRTETIFLEEEIHLTRDRTGILIFISEAEHKVVVMADKGINKVVDQKDWDEVVGLIINGIKNKKIVEGIVEAIESCKKLLLDRGFVVREDDTDELSNELRTDD